MDEAAAEKLFCHKVLALLDRRGLPSQERIELLVQRRQSGFSVHNRVFVHPRDGREFEALVRYLMRRPVSLLDEEQQALAADRVKLQLSRTVSTRAGRSRALPGTSA